MDYVKAFIVGGLICAAVQILLDRTKLMPGRVMVLLVCGGALLGFCGLYDPFQKLAGAGGRRSPSGIRQCALAGRERSC